MPHGIEILENFPKDILLEIMNLYDQFRKLYNNPNKGMILI